MAGHPFWRGSDDVPDLPKPRVMEDAIRLIPGMLQGVKNLTDHTMMKNGDWMEIGWRFDHVFRLFSDFFPRFWHGFYAILLGEWFREHHCCHLTNGSFVLCDLNLHQNWSSLVVTRLACKPPLHKQQLCLQFWLRLQFTPSLLCKASILCCSKALFVIELDDGKIYRKALYLMVKTMVSG